MICVKTKIKQSEISGIGLFADEYIPKGTVVWRFEPSFDILMTKEEIENLSKPAQEQFYNYCFFDNNYNKYVLCGDDARFFNHSNNSNCNDSLPDITTALRDINPEEELTVNYKTFNGDIIHHPDKYEWL